MNQYNSPLRQALLSTLEKANESTVRQICSRIPRSSERKRIRKLEDINDIAVELIDYFDALPHHLGELLNIIENIDKRLHGDIEKKWSKLREQPEGNTPLEPSIDKNHIQYEISTNDEIRDIFDFVLEEQDWYAPSLPENRQEIRADKIQSLNIPIDLVLVTATQIERGQVLKLLTPCPDLPGNLSGQILQVLKKQETYYLGVFGKFTVAVVMCAMGSDGANGSQAAITDALTSWQPTAVMMIGTACGAHPSKQKRGDVLVPEYIINYENDRSRPESDAILRNRFRNVDFCFKRPNGDICTMHKHSDGLLCAGKKIDAAKLQKLKERYPNAIGGEMEAVGLATAAQRQQTPWVIVKAISDFGEDKHDRYRALAAASAAQLVYEVLSHEGALHGLPKNR